jgi:hypothetical protein
LVDFIKYRFYFTLFRLNKEEQSLLKMGISQAHVEKLIMHWLQHQKLQHQKLHESLGQIIWQTAKSKRISPKEAGKRLSAGLYWDEWKKLNAAKMRLKK